MTPDDVAADHSLLFRFQEEVAYLARELPSESTRTADADLLRSGDALLIVAWLWPTMADSPTFDPFAAAARAREALRDDLVGHAEAGTRGRTADALLQGVDRIRMQWRRVAAQRFSGMVDWAAREAARPVDDIKAHLSWRTSISRTDLDDLLDGRATFGFEAIGELRDALQLEFDGGWVIIDPPRLARRVDQSVLAAGIVERLRVLQRDNLESVAKRLPRGPLGDPESSFPNSYRAPAPGARYSSLYEALASDERDHPTYTLSEIDEILVHAGEAELPDSARRSDASWWAGDGVKSEGRPQVRAWWGAGFKVRHATLTGQTAHVEFEAIPGRSAWLTDPERIARREYSAPEPERVRVHPELPAQFDSEAFLAALAPVLEGLTALRATTTPGDPAIDELVQLLDSVGEVDRSAIEIQLDGGGDDREAAWMTNLLTRARRQGWIINKGTRKHPRWASTVQRTLLIRTIAEKCNLPVPSLEPADPVPTEFLVAVASAIGVDSAGESCVQVARDIVESRRAEWTSAFESADGSITSTGLQAVDHAIGSSWLWREEWD